MLSERNTMFIVEFPLTLMDVTPVRSGEVISRQSPFVGLLHDFIVSLFRQQWSDAVDSVDRDALGDTISTMLRRALNTNAATLVTDTDQGAQRRVLAYIEANLDHSALRTGLVADRLGMSARAVQSIFTDMATTTSAYIVERRLSRAAERLRDPQDYGSLTDLALELGFSDAAHFARRFKARFGVTPGQFARTRQHQ